MLYLDRQPSMRRKFGLTSRCQAEQALKNPVILQINEGLQFLRTNPSPVLIEWQASHNLLPLQSADCCLLRAPGGSELEHCYGICK